MRGIFDPNMLANLFGERNRCDCARGQLGQDVASSLWLFMGLIGFGFFDGTCADAQG